MRRLKATPVELLAEEKQTLQRIVRAYTLPHKVILRAKIILKAAEGQANARIAQQLQISAEMVRKWRNRFSKDRLKGLRDLPRSGAPSAFSP